MIALYKDFADFIAGILNTDPVVVSFFLIALVVLVCYLFFSHIFRIVLIALVVAVAAYFVPQIRVWLAQSITLVKQVLHNLS